MSPATRQPAQVSKGRAAAAALTLGVALAVTGCATNAAPDGSSDPSEKSLTVAFVPKLEGIPYFDAMNSGGTKAAADLGVTWIYRGAATADPSAQADIVRSLIQQRVDVIAVAPDDPDSLAPVLADAEAKGIRVITSDTDAPDSVREVFVSQATAGGMAHALTDALMEKMGGKGVHAIVSCGETAGNLNAWIDAQKKYTTERYPNARIVSTVYAGEDQAKAAALARNLMTANPNLTGLVGECTTSAPGVAAGVRQAGKIGKVYTVGVGTPQTMLPYLQDGSSSAAILWNVENLGYLTVWAAKQLAEGKPFQDVNSVTEEMSATSVVGLLATPNAAELWSTPLFPDEAVVLGRPAWVPYATPGVRLGRAVRDAIRRYRETEGTPPRLVLLGNHGIVALGATAAEVEAITVMCVKAARVRAVALGAGGYAPLDAAEADSLARRPDEVSRRRLLGQV